MKFIRNTFRSLQAHDKALCVTYALALLALVFVLGAEKARAQSGNVYAAPQAQVAGQVFDAVVLQVTLRDVDASMPARAVGGGLGAAAGLLLASNAGSQHRGAANTAGALLGGLLGERTANAVMKVPAQELIVRFVLPNGLPKTVVIVQPAPFDQIFPQEAVYVSEVRGTFRVLKRTL
mgnify:CR=1 FL=1